MARAQARLTATRDALTAMERQARETEAKIAAVADAKARTTEALGRGTQALVGRDRPAGAGGQRAAGGGAGRGAEKEPASCAPASARRRTELIALEREHRARTERQAAIGPSGALDHARGRG